MGIAQGVERLVHIARECIDCEDYGFIFIGRGSESDRLKSLASKYCLTNTIFFDEIDSKEVSGLLEQCSVGMIALDSRHTTHNIPGKFLSYISAGIPVLALVNPGNDLEDLIRDHKLGICSISSNILDPVRSLMVLTKTKQDPQFKAACEKLVNDLFSNKVAAMKIIQAFQ